MMKLHDLTVVLSFISGFRFSWSGTPPVPPKGGTGCGIKKSALRYFCLLAAYTLLHISNAPCALDRDCYPQRIISLGPFITEELYLLGAEDKIVGVTNYCTRPPQSLQKEKVGAVIEVNLEKIVALKPDLVIATPLTGIRSVAKLKALGVRVMEIPQPRDFNQMCQQFLKLGEVIGKKKEAEEIVYKMKGKINVIKNRTDGLPKARVFVQIGARPLVTANRGSFIDNLIELSGGINVAKVSEDLSYMPYSREKVLEADPDYIIIVTMGIAGEEEKRRWESFKNLKAVKNKRIYTLNSYDICSLTPVTFVDAVKHIAGILHPNK